MKRMRKVMSLLIAAMLMILMVMPVSAEQTQKAAEIGAITISGVNAHETYTGYKIFDATYSTSDEGTKNIAYTIKADNPVKALVDVYTYQGVKVFTLTQSDTESSVYKVDVNEIFDTETAAIDFANYLAASLDVIPLPPTATGKVAADIVDNDNYQDILTNYTVQNNITEVVNNGQNTVYWTNLSYGYWFVTTTTGTLCNLTIAAPSITIADKNKDVTIEKEVKEATNGNWGEENAAQIGDVVEFRTTIHVPKGAENYKLYDRLYDGDSDAVAFTLYKDTITPFIDADKDGSYDEGETKLTLTTDYKIDYDVEYKKGSMTYVCDFCITFEDSFLATITTDTDIVVTYSALLDKGAAVEGDGFGDDYNTNDTWLTYGSGSESNWEQTKTYTLFFDLIKVDGENKGIEGAQFGLYYDEACTMEVPLVDEGSHMYRVATPQEITENEHHAIIEAGHADISGLDRNKTYYLKEVKAPAGYNMVNEIIPVKIDENSIATSYVSGTWNEDMGGIVVVNHTGAELPTTGAAGTKLIYIAGAALFTTAVVIIVTKKRMSIEEE